MQPHELSITGKLDIALTKGLCLLFGWLITAAIWLVGVFQVAEQPKLIFEYDEGLADLSWLEWGGMLLSVLLLWRHIHYCRQFSTGFWRGLSLIFTFQGRLACVGFGLLGLIIYLEDGWGGQLQPFSAVSSPIAELVGCSVVLLALYIAAPTTAVNVCKPESNTKPQSPSATVEREVNA